MPSKTYILDMADGTQKKVTVPDTWKVTFGPLVPGSKDGNYNSRGGLALRFYETKDQQRAVFMDVKCFRDADIPVMEKVVKVQEKRVAQDNDGRMKHYTVRAEETSWRPADEDKEPDPGFMQLPTGLLDEEDIGG